MEDLTEGQIIRNERGGEVIANEALENFKAMFNFIKGKRDTDIKLFKEDKLINRSDIIDLNQKIQDKLHLHTIHGSVVNVSVTLSNSEIKTFGNWGAFESYGWHQTAFTVSLVLEWDFNVTFPNHTVQIPQPHSMRVRIGAGLRPNELFHVVMTGAEDFEIGEAMSDVVFKIDFVNTQLCAELKNIVTEWHDSLPNNKQQNFLIRFSKRHKGKIELLLNVLILLAFVFVANIAVKTAIPYLNLVANKDLFKWVYLVFTASIPVFYVIYKVGDFYSERVIERTIARYRKNPMINLTRGDNNRITDATNANKKLLNDLGLNIGVTLIITLLSTVLDKVLPAVIKWLIKIYMS